MRIVANASSIATVLPADLAEFLKVHPRVRIDLAERIKNSVTLAHYKSGSTGVEMTYATQVVYFSPTYSFAEYLQSIGRVYRNGQLEKTTFYNLRTPNTIEEDIYTVLKTKNDFQIAQWVKKLDKEEE